MTLLITSATYPSFLFVYIYIYVHFCKNVFPKRNLMTTLFLNSEKFLAELIFRNNVKKYSLAKMITARIFCGKLYTWLLIHLWLMPSLIA